MAEEFHRAGLALTAEMVARFFTGRRPADMFAAVETAAGRKLPPDFAATVAAATLRRFRAELRATPRGLRADLAARAEMRGVIVVARPHPGEP